MIPRCEILLNRSVSTVTSVRENADVGEGDV